MLGKPAFTNKLVAKNLGIDCAKVSSVTDFFYKELDNELKSCKHPFVFVRGLGTFSLSVRPIERMIKTYLRRMRGSAQTENTESIIKKELFELFRIRRLIKNQLKENKKLQDALKNVDDTQGKCLSAIGNQ